MSHLYSLCVPVTEAVEVVCKRLQDDPHLMGVPWVSLFHRAIGSGGSWVKIKSRDVPQFIQLSARKIERIVLWEMQTKQSLAKHMSQHRRATPSGQNYAFYLHLKDRDHFAGFRSWAGKNAGSRGVEAAVYVQKEQPSLNRGGGLRVHLSHLDML